MNSLLLAGAGNLLPVAGDNNYEPIGIDRFIAVAGQDIVEINSGVKTVHTPAAGRIWTDVCAADGKIVAVSRSSKRVAIYNLTPGRWTTPIITGTDQGGWDGVIFRDSTWYLAGAASTVNPVDRRVYSSTDLVNWSVTPVQETFRPSGRWCKLSLIGNTLILPSQTGTNAVFIDTVSGEADLRVSNVSGGGFHYVTGSKFTNGKLFLFGEGNGISEGTLDENGNPGNTFVRRNWISSSTFIHDLAYHPDLDLYVAVGGTGAIPGTDTVFFTSPDGVVWTQKTNMGSTAIGSSNPIHSLVRENGKLLLGTKNGKIFRMESLDTFTELHDLGSSNPIYNIRVPN